MGVGAGGEGVSLTSLEGVSLTELASCSANGMVCASDIWFSSEDVGESWARAAQSNVVGIEPGVGSGRSAASSDRGCVHGAWCGSSEGPWPLVLGLQRMRLRSTPAAHTGEGGERGLRRAGPLRREGLRREGCWWGDIRHPPRCRGDHQRT